MVGKLGRIGLNSKTMADILDGKIPREEIRSQLAGFVTNAQDKPTLAIIQVGDRPDSTAYIEQKKKFADSIGAKVIHKRFPNEVGQEELVSAIQTFNADKDIHGILIQIPLPPHLDKETLIDTVNPGKDVDGLTSANFKRLFEENMKAGFIPATAKGVVALLDFYKIEISKKKVVVVGRSSLVGKPTALALLNRDATVTIAHKETQNLAELTKTADILIVAIGDPEFITKDYVKEGQTVIDVGINPDGTGRVVGDVKRSDIESIVGAISPVPGGVGPMTVASLFQNLIEAYDRSKEKK
jgi:methylenetetrahydrofolate dehydrogenase (NADP+)/methenyltetrahydrofolate cyclohydrolase